MGVMTNHSIELKVHRCTGIEVGRSSPGNSNSINLKILGGEKNHVACQLLMFGLPEEVTQKLMLAFATPETIISD